MKRTFALKAHDQSARFGHFGGVIFDHIFSFESLADFGWGYFAFKHALNGVDAVENFGHGVIILCSMLVNALYREEREGREEMT